MKRRLPVLALLALALVVLGPAALHPASRFAGTDYLDTYGTQWFYWWVQRAVERGLPLDRTDLIFHPWGKDVYLHTGGNLLDAFLALPLRAALGPVAGTNLWVLLVLLGNALAAERIAAAAGLGAAGRAVAAVLALLDPFALQELQAGRPTQAMLVFLGLWLATLLRPPSVRAALAGGAWLALAGYGYWFAGLVGGVAGGVTLAVRLVLGPRRRAEAARVLGAGALALLLVGPAVLPVLGREVPGLLALAEEPGPLGRLVLRTVEGDPQSLFVLALDGRGGRLFDEDGLRFDPGVRLLGVAQLLAVAGGLALGRRRAAVPAAWLAAALLVALGPAVVVGRHFVANPVFLFLYEHAELVRRWWWPGRALALAGFAVALLGGLAADRLARRGGALTVAAPALAALLAFVGAARAGLAPLDSWPSAVSPGIRCLRDAPEGVVLELPYRLGQRPLYHQTVHEHPILNGMLVTKAAFVPEGARRLWTDNSFVALLLALGERDWRRPKRWDEADREAFLTLGYRYVVVRKEGFVRPRPRPDGTVRIDSDWPRARRHFRPVLGLPDWEDEEVAIYVVDDTPFDCP